MMVHNIFEKLAEISIGQEIFVKFLKSSLVLRTFQIYGLLDTFGSVPKVIFLLKVVESYSVIL